MILWLDHRALHPQESPGKMTLPQLGGKWKKASELGVDLLWECMTQQGIEEFDHWDQMDSEKHLQHLGIFSSSSTRTPSDILHHSSLLSRTLHTVPKYTAFLCFYFQCKLEHVSLFDQKINFESETKIVMIVWKLSKINQTRICLTLTKIA